MTWIQQSKIVVESSLVQDEDLSEGIEHDISHILNLITKLSWVVEGDILHLS